MQQVFGFHESNSTSASQDRRIKTEKREKKFFSCAAFSRSRERRSKKIVALFCYQSISLKESPPANGLSGDAMLIIGKLFRLIEG